MATAQLLFYEGDHLWHLYPGGEFLESKRLHPQPGDQVHLIAIPVILWSQASPVFTDLKEIEDPFDAVERARQLKLGEKVEQARSLSCSVRLPRRRDGLWNCWCPCSDRENKTYLWVYRRRAQQIEHDPS